MTAFVYADAPASASLDADCASVQEHQADLAVREQQVVLVGLERRHDVRRRQDRKH